jgi:hypothetical protein
MKTFAAGFIILFIPSTIFAMSPRQCSAKLKEVNSVLKGKLDLDDSWNRFDNENESSSIVEVKTATVQNGLYRKNLSDGSRLPLETFIMTVAFKSGKKIYLRTIEDNVNWPSGPSAYHASWLGDYTMVEVDENFATRLNDKVFHFNVQAGIHSTTIIRGKIGSQKFLGIGGH